MARPFSHLVAIALLSAMVATSTGAACLLWASAAPSHRAGCHPARVPSRSEHADSRCCVSGHASALTTKVFSPRPTLQAMGDDAADLLSTARESDAVPAILAASAPPGITPLRI